MNGREWNVTEQIRTKQTRGGEARRDETNAKGQGKAKQGKQDRTRRGKQELVRRERDSRMGEDEMGQVLWVSQQFRSQIEENDAGRIRVDNRARQRCQHTEERQDPEAYHESDWEGHQGNEGFNKKPCS